MTSHDLASVKSVEIVYYSYSRFGNRWVSNEMSGNLCRRFPGRFSVRYPHYPDACRTRTNLCTVICGSAASDPAVVAASADAGIDGSAFDARPRYRYSARKVDMFFRYPDNGYEIRHSRGNMYARDIGRVKCKYCDYHYDRAPRS